MRIFNLEENWYDHILRDLMKRSVFIPVDRMQNKDVGKDHSTLELLNYSFMLANITSLTKCKKFIQPTNPWADSEFQERINPEYQNPGKAWKLRLEVWKEYLLSNQKFDYTYNERIRMQLPEVIRLLESHKYTRQAIISIYDPLVDVDRLGRRRIPCSLQYIFLFRESKLHIIYYMRSCDITLHFRNDIYLAIKMLHHVANKLQMNVGNLHVNIANLHIFKKDIPKNYFEDQV